MIRKLQALRSVRGVAFAVGVFVATVLVLADEKVAFAQPRPTFGSQGQLAITAENLFGFSMERVGTEGPNDSETSNTYSNFGILHRSTVYRGPWVGVHYFIIPNLSLGGTLGMVLTGGSRTQSTPSMTTTTDSASGMQLVFIPKVGYVLMLTDILGFWFRGGPGLIYGSSWGPDDDDTTRSQSYWLLSLDALFVIMPVQHFGFYVGPQGNFSFAGSSSATSNSTTVSWDSNFRSFSIDAGLIGYFDL
jgi:hypothetical protein